MCNPEKDVETVAIDKAELERIIQSALVSAAIEGAAIAMAKMEKRSAEERATARKRILHNTRLLLKNYLSMKENCLEAVYQKAMARQTDQEYFDLLMRGKDDQEDLVIASIKESAERTAVILAHIDKMLEIYKGICKRGGTHEKRRYEVLRHSYLLKKQSTVSELAMKFDVSDRTIQKDKEIAEERLSVLLFGFEGLHLGI